MRFRFTIFLILANVALFFAIWTLEIKSDKSVSNAAESISFTRLEIHGKNMDKPRVLSLENHKWRIISPIDWAANLFAVNRIRNQLEFLSKETSFNLSDMKKYGHTLEEYGLGTPLFTIKYGNAKNLNSIRVGNTAPIGNRVYMYDEAAGKIIVVDKEFVEGLILDVERLRNQLVFDIPRFEVASFSIRMPQGDEKSGQGNFRRIGLIKEDGKWKFETPITVAADTQEVEAFLNDICHLSAKSFEIDSREDTGFSVIPTTITLQGTNRRRVLILGGLTKDGSQIYARLEDNPTVFTIDSAKFKNLAGLQNTLRDKSLLHFSVSDIDNIDISKDGKILKLRKLTGGVWDVIGAGSKGDTLTAKADLAKVNTLLTKLDGVRARDFVNDIPADNLSVYGMDANALTISITGSDQKSYTFTIGSHYKLGGATLAYAKTNASPAICGISRDLENAVSTDFLFYRSRILEALPEKAIISSVKIIENKTGEILFSANSENGDFKKAFDALKPRDAASAKTLVEFVKRFVVREYLNENFSDAGAVAGGKTYPWTYTLQADIDLPGTGEAIVAEKREWKISNPLGGTTQYGGNKRLNSTFSIELPLLDALRELTLERKAPEELNVPAPVPASKSSVKTDTLAEKPAPTPAQSEAVGQQPSNAVAPAEQKK